MIWFHKIIFLKKTFKYIIILNSCDMKEKQYTVGQYSVRDESLNYYFVKIMFCSYDSTNLSIPKLIRIQHIT